ncbi:MAG: hypothetical protein GX444_10490 [Myxococcales bacterium]|nr:hypothetical protein [Myxococcales bacterium]
MKRAQFSIVVGVVLALTVVTALAADTSTKAGINLTKEFTVLGKKVVVDIASPGRVEITVDGKLRYTGGPGFPTETHGGYKSHKAPGSPDVEGVCVAADFADVVHLKDHSVLVFETWYKVENGLLGRVWLESVWPTDEKGVVDGYLMNHDGTYHDCIETLPAGTDPMKAQTAVKTVSKKGDTEFQYRCGGWGEHPASTAVYKRVLQYDIVEPPISDK